MEFDGDDHNRAHCQKHCVSIAEIEELFEGQDGFVVPDRKHSVRQLRFIAIGTGARGRKIFVAFSENARQSIADPADQRATDAQEGDQRL